MSSDSASRNDRFSIPRRLGVTCRTAVLFVLSALAISRSADGQSDWRVRGGTGVAIGGGGGSEPAFILDFSRTLEIAIERQLRPGWAADLAVTDIRQFKITRVACTLSCGPKNHVDVRAVHAAFHRLVSGSTVGWNTKLHGGIGAYRLSPRDINGSSSSSASTHAGVLAAFDLVSAPYAGFAGSVGLGVTALPSVGGERFVIWSINLAVHGR